MWRSVNFYFRSRSDGPAGTSHTAGVESSDMTVSRRCFRTLPEKSHFVVLRTDSLDRE
eukprot:gene4350-3164_t